MCTSEKHSIKLDATFLPLGPVNDFLYNLNLLSTVSEAQSKAQLRLIETAPRSDLVALVLGLSLVLHSITTFDIKSRG